MDKILEVNKIEKYYGNKANLTKAIDNISFSVNKGEFVGIMGASGSGKSTYQRVQGFTGSTDGKTECVKVKIPAAALQYSELKRDDI